ncbi:MAG: rRNA maturation RNase YbeY [Fusobacteria bacterium]|nr:rRNA maturation RNase YbeY [Fusobacteriota bacterium]
MSIVVDFALREGVEFPEFNELKIQNICSRVVEGELEVTSDIYISMLVTNNSEIQEINREYRGKDLPTDVISFAYHDSEYEGESPLDVLGDIIISVEKVREQAESFGHGFERELYYLLIHGLLHLCGYDHIIENEKKFMREKEEEYYKLLVLESK